MVQKIVSVLVKCLLDLGKEVSSFQGSFSELSSYMYHGMHTWRRWLLSRLFSRVYISACSKTSLPGVFRDRSMLAEGGARETGGGAAEEAWLPVLAASLVMVVSMDESAAWVALVVLGTELSCEAAVPFPCCAASLAMCCSKRACSCCNCCSCWSCAACDWLSEPASWLC